MAATGWYLRVFGHPELPAAQFALRSSYLKGVILCDEGSLGKTYEALLAVTQLWYEGKNNIVLVKPTPLLEPHRLPAPRPNKPHATE